MNTWARTCLSTWSIPRRWNTTDGVHQLEREEEAIPMSREREFWEVNSDLFAIFWIENILTLNMQTPLPSSPWAHEDSISTCSICVPNPTPCDLLLLSLWNLRVCSANILNGWILQANSMDYDLQIARQNRAVFVMGMKRRCLSTLHSIERLFYSMIMLPFMSDRYMRGGYETTYCFISSSERKGDLFKVLPSWSLQCPESHGNNVEYPPTFLFLLPLLLVMQKATKMVSVKCECQVSSFPKETF